MIVIRFLILEIYTRITITKVKGLRNNEKWYDFDLWALQ